MWLAVILPNGLQKIITLSVISLRGAPCIQKYKRRKCPTKCEYKSLWKITELFNKKNTKMVWLNCLGGGLNHHHHYSYVGPHPGEDEMVNNNPRIIFKIPRVLPNQRKIYETEDFFKKHSKEGEVRKKWKFKYFIIYNLLNLQDWN
jgi:hypothetical protein